MSSVNSRRFGEELRRCVMAVGKRIINRPTKAAPLAQVEGKGSAPNWEPASSV